MRSLFRLFGIEISSSIGPDENLAGKNLRRRDFAGAILRGRDLSGANLAGANLAGRDLSGANLSGANLRGAVLTPGIPRGLQRYREPANLSGANLSGANLSGANLTDANLSGANLTGANLRGANLTNASGVPVRQEGTNLNFAKQQSENPAGTTLREFLTSGFAMEKSQENQNVLQRWRDVDLSGAIMPDGTIHD